MLKSVTLVSLPPLFFTTRAQRKRRKRKFLVALYIHLFQVLSYATGKYQTAVQLVEFQSE